MGNYKVMEAKTIVRLVDGKQLPDKLAYNKSEPATTIMEFESEKAAKYYLKSNPSYAGYIMDDGFKRYAAIKHFILKDGELVTESDYLVDGFKGLFLWQDVKLKHGTDTYWCVGIPYHKWYADKISMGGFECEAVRSGDRVNVDGTAPLYLIRWNINDGTDDVAAMYNEKIADYIYKTDRRTKVRSVV